MLHPDENQIREAMRDAIKDRGSERVIREVQGVAVNTVRNFVRGDRQTRRETLDAVRQWYADHHPEGMETHSREREATPSDYWRGVLYAAEAMAEVTHRLLREEREADEQTVRQTVKAALFQTLPASESVHPETSSAAASTAPPRGKAKRA